MELLLGVIIFVLDIWAIVNIIQSKESGMAKLIWCLAILLLPLIGLIVWFFIGPRKVNI
ncbi:MAG: PLDc N-terminal domain-containing protein [Desulfovermiculus sp.]